MATSETYTFNLDIADIIEEAYERIGVEAVSGYQMSTARRSLNLLLTEWANRGINLWTMDQTSVTLSSGTNTYTLNSQIIDVIDAVSRNSDNTDTPTTRLSLSDYLNYPTKSTTGQPVQWALERNSIGGHTLYVYPTPDATYTFQAWTIRYAEDIGVYTNNPEIPRRFLPSLVSGLAFYLAGKNHAKTELNEQGRRTVIAGVDINRRQELKGEYESDFEAAKTEDHERASLFVVPNVAMVI